MAEIKSMGQFEEMLEKCDEAIAYCIAFLEQQSRDCGTDGRNIRELLAVIRRMFDWEIK